MIGWWIIVSTHSPRERDQADPTSRRAANLAQWEAGADGLRWVDELVEQGLAEKLSDGGYPKRYTALARDVLPHLVEELGPSAGALIVGADYAEASDWHGKPDLNAGRIAACPADHPLTIDAWDQS